MNKIFHFSLFERKGVLLLLGFVLCVVWIPDWYRSKQKTDPINIWMVLETTDGTSYQAATESISTGGPKSSNSGMYAEKDRNKTSRHTYSPNTTTAPIVHDETEGTANVYINQATPEEWRRLRGIGPVYSERIVAFRKALGGFSTINQIQETYGISDSLFQEIKPFLTLTQPPRRMKVNFIGQEALASHPYISEKQAEAIVHFRNNHGSFDDQQSFKVLTIFSEYEHNRLKPYLSYENE